jgi:uncharacterized protein
MKKALILHNTSGSPLSNWYLWLQRELETLGWAVWVPQLPDADNPNITNYNTVLLQREDWLGGGETVIIGHSSGSVAALGLLQKLSGNSQIATCYLIGSFKDDLGWPNLGGLFTEPFDFDRIKSRCGQFVFLHSDDDPYCPLEHAKYLADKLDGELIVQPGQKHFSEETDPKYTTFPFLLDLVLRTQP